MNETTTQEVTTAEAGRADLLVTHQEYRIIEERRERVRRKNIAKAVHIAAMNAISQWIEFSEKTGSDLSWSVFINDFDSDSAFPGELGKHKKIAYDVMKQVINMSELEFARYFEA